MWNYCLRIWISLFWSAKCYSVFGARMLQIHNFAELSSRRFVLVESSKCTRTWTRQQRARQKYVCCLHMDRPQYRIFSVPYLPWLLCICHFFSFISRLHSTSFCFRAPPLTKGCNPGDNLHQHDSFACCMLGSCKSQQCIHASCLAWDIAVAVGVSFRQVVHAESRAPTLCLPMPSKACKRDATALSQAELQMLLTMWSLSEVDMQDAKQQQQQRAWVLAHYFAPIKQQRSGKCPAILRLGVLERATSFVKSTHWTEFVDVWLTKPVGQLIFFGSYAMRVEHICVFNDYRWYCDHTKRAARSVSNSALLF